MTDQELKEKRLAFLNETVAYYNSQNRGLTKHGACSYVAGCAIGRHCSPELCEQLDGKVDGSVSYFGVFELLPDRLQELGQQFLISMQILHDFEHNWDKSGLSEQGHNSVNEIKKSFNLN